MEGGKERVRAGVHLRPDKTPVDVGTVSLNTSMAMPGMAPMVTGASLTAEGPGRYRGMINFPDRGAHR